MRVPRILAALWLGLATVFGAQSAMESPAQTYIVGAGVSITFGTHAECKSRWPQQFKEYEPPGWILHGEFMPVGYRGHTRDFIFIVVDDPSVYTRGYVDRLARMMFGISQVGFKLNEVDILSDCDDQLYFEAGILYHELSHLSDSKPDWYGQQALMLSKLFPSSVPKLAEQPRSNPWQILRVFWPEACTHPDKDMADYAKGF